MYVLDNEKGRIVVTDKNGEYKAQYLGDVVKNADNLVVSEKEKKVFVLTGNKLFFLNLKHLD